MRSRLASPAAVSGYLLTIVAANLSLAHFGPQAAPINALVFVAADLVLRDYLHDRWRRHLTRSMAGLIVAGSSLSVAMATLTTPAELDVVRISVASAIAFGAAAATDTVAYSRLVRRHWLERSPLSNTVSAAVDSVLFLPLAGAGFPWLIILSLWTSKVAGGYLWAVAIGRRHAVLVADASC